MQRGVQKRKERAERSTEEKRRVERRREGKRRKEGAERSREEKGREEQRREEKKVLIKALST